MHPDRIDNGPIVKHDEPAEDFNLKVFTVSEVAKILRIGKDTAYEAVRRGEIPHMRFGKRIVVPAVALAKLMAGEAAVPKKRR